MGDTCELNNLSSSVLQISRIWSKMGKISVYHQIAKVYWSFRASNHKKEVFSGFRDTPSVHQVCCYRCYCCDLQLFIPDLCVTHWPDHSESGWSKGQGLHRACVCFRNRQPCTVPPIELDLTLNLNMTHLIWLLWRRRKNPLQIRARLFKFVKIWDWNSYLSSMEGKPVQMRHSIQKTMLPIKKIPLTFS